MSTPRIARRLGPRFRLGRRIGRLALGEEPAELVQHLGKRLILRGRLRWPKIAENATVKLAKLAETRTMLPNDRMLLAWRTGKMLPVFQ